MAEIFWLAGFLALGFATYFWLWPFLAAGFVWVAAINFGAILTVFAVGSLWFWLLLIAESGLMCFYLVNDSDDKESVGFGAAISMIVTIVLLGVFGNLFSYLLSNLFFLAYMVVGYLLAGVVYMCARVYFFSREASDAYQECVDDFCKTNNVREESVLADPVKLRNMREYVQGHARYGSPLRRLNFDRGKVLIREHKARAMTWLTFWPWSLIWWAFHDMLNKLFNEIFRLMSTQLQRIADYGSRDINKYFPEEKDNNPPPDSGIKEAADKLAHDLRSRS